MSEEDTQNKTRARDGDGERNSAVVFEIRFPENASYLNWIFQTDGVAMAGVGRGGSAEFSLASPGRLLAGWRLAGWLVTGWELVPSKRCQCTYLPLSLP